MKTNCRTLILGLLFALAALPLTVSAANDAAGLKFNNFASEIVKTVSCAKGKAQYRLEYSIDWPVSGNPDAVNFARKWMISAIAGEENIDPATLSTPESLLNSVAENGAKDLKAQISNDYDPDADGEYRGITIEAEVNGSNCTLTSSNVYQPYGTTRIFEDTDNITFDIKAAKSFSLDMLKNIPNLSDIIWLSELAQGEDFHEVFVNTFGGLYSPIEDIPTPTFTKGGVTFSFPLYLGGLGGLPYEIEVPYDEIVPLMTDEAISFIPEEYLNNYYKDDGQLTEGIVHRLWWFGLPDHARLNKYTGQALSREFEKAVERDWRLDEESDEEVGYEEAYYWYATQETNENGMKIKSVAFPVMKDDQATAIVNFELFEGNPRGYVLSLIKEPRKLKNGKIVKKWVIDDFIKDGFQGKWSKKEGKEIKF